MLNHVDVMLPESFQPQLLRQLELLRLRNRRAFLGGKQGGHLSLRRGHGIEFSDYRKYEPGDNPRSIDWGVYARSDRLYIKRFQEEQDISLLILLDASASMGVCQLGRKWNYARDMALALAYVALMQQDSVILSVPGQIVARHFSGAKAIRSIAKQALQVSPVGQPDLIKAAQVAASHIRFPGMAVVISDFLVPLPQIYSVFNILRAKNLDISAVQVLSETDVEPWSQQQGGTFIDSETGEQLDLVLGDDGNTNYQILLEKHNNELSGYLLDNQIGFAQIRTGYDFDNCVVDGLLESGLLK